MWIDAHTHIFHPKVAPRAIAYLQTEHNITVKGSGTAEELLEIMHSLGIAKSVVHTAATTASQVIPANNWTIQLQRNYPALIPFGSIHPDFENNEEELKRLEKNRIQGLKIHPDFQGFSMDDSRFIKLLEMANNRFIVMFHIGSPQPMQKSPSCPKKLAQLQKIFPETPMIAAHLGGLRYWDAAIEAIAGTNVYVDTSSTLLHTRAELFCKFINKHGKERTLFGSDYPICSPAEELQLLEQKAGLSTKDIESLLLAGKGLFNP